MVNSHVCGDEISEGGSSPRLPLPVADEGRRGESPRSKERYTPLVGVYLDSGTASVNACDGA